MRTITENINNPGLDCSPLVKVATIHPRHVKQLHWIHDEAYNFADKIILGKYDGAIITQHKTGQIDRVSVTVFWQQEANRTGNGKAARLALEQIRQLFTDEA